MSDKDLSVKSDNARLARLILLGPVGNYIYEYFTKTDYERQVEALQRMKEKGLDCTTVKMSSKHEKIIRTKNGEIVINSQNDGEYNR